MSRNSEKWSVVTGRWSVRKSTYCLLLAAYCLLALGCRYDMQDQPRYTAQKKSDFFKDGKAMRDLPEGTVSRGNLREDKAFYTGKKETAGGASAAPVQTMTDASGNTLVASFPDAIEEFPVPVTEELINRGEERYKVFCIVCHGPVGNGDGMIVRRGFPKPPTYNDDRLRNAPVGHFYDVITNGWGKMNSYASQVPVADRWAIVAYIRTLQISQNPNGNIKMTSSNSDNTTNTTANTAVTATPTLPNANRQGGAR
ncbi:MAG: cytochrome c [Acidobacteria bacterium]|nr:cytochrome c [Acidobacteriota bacterium]MCA1638976.1 cytochrome c [Acidobacteriota bacterium]